MTGSDHAPARSLTPVVTLFESYGSGAAYIGPRVAQALRLPFHEQAFSSQELEDAMTTRESKGLLAQVFGAMGGSYAGHEGPSVAMAQQDNHQLVMDNTRTVTAAAREGGVITGRNGALILAEWPGALHVLLDGPLEQRIRRAAAESGIGFKQAARRQKREDQVRADISIQFYGWDPRDTHGYDLVVNTGTMQLDDCVEIIVHAARVKAGVLGVTSP
jgi:cytidylate kinase